MAALPSISDVRSRRSRHRTPLVPQSNVRCGRAERVGSAYALLRREHGTSLMTCVDSRRTVTVVRVAPAHTAHSADARQRRSVSEFSGEEAEGEAEPGRVVVPDA